MDGAPVTPRTALTTVTITVERNLESPTFIPDPLTTPQSYVFYVIETRPVGTFIGQVQAQDLDTQVIFCLTITHGNIFLKVILIL